KSAQRVHGEMVFDADGGRPGDALNQADAAVGGQQCPDIKRAGQRHERGDERYAARMPTRKERDGRTDQRQHGECSEDVRSYHGRLLQMRTMTSTTKPSASSRR